MTRSWRSPPRCRRARVSTCSPRPSPGRTYDVGIAEQHAVTFAAGLATEGYRPFCAIYSTFLQRAYDQIVHDVAIQNLPVRFALDRAGLVGADGPTHAGSFDIAYLGCLPNFTIMAAADEAELVHMVATAVAHDTGPIAFRYPRGEGVGVDMPEKGVPLEIGKGRIVKQGSRIAILSLGTRLKEALGAAEDLDARGLSTTVADARFAQTARRGTRAAARPRTRGADSPWRKARSAGSAPSCCIAWPRTALWIAASRCGPWCCPTSSSTRTSPTPCMRRPGSTPMRSSRRSSRRSVGNADGREAGGRAKIG